MWLVLTTPRLADSAPSGNAGNLALIVVAVVTVIGAVVVALINKRGARSPERSEVAKGQDEAVAAYRKTYAEPLRKELAEVRRDAARELDLMREDRDRERERRIAAETESDGHRRRWVECEQRHVGHAHD